VGSSEFGVRSWESGEPAHGTAIATLDSQSESPNPQLLTPNSELRTPNSIDRELIEFVVLGFTIAILLCGFIVQPYFVPSGSMATVLLGLHKDVHCSQCGATFPVGVDEAGDARTDAVQCPHCGKSDLPLAGLPVAKGDQVLVWKDHYTLRPIRRWEMVVFMHPETPRECFVKRAAGLPGEMVQIKHGDVYIDGEIAAKKFEQLMAMSIPIGRIADLENPGPSCLSVVRSQDGRGLRIAGVDDEGQPAAIRDLLSYNAGGDTWEREPVRDVIAAMNVGERVELQFHGLPGTPIRLLIEYGEAWLFVGGKSVRGNALPKGVGRRLVFAYWDGRIGVRWNGKLVFEEWSLPPTASDRESAHMTPLVTLANFDAVPSDFELSRDVYYTERVGGARGVGIDEPYRLRPNEYFMLGDNSDVSRDSRAWDHPGVPEELFVGKPVLVFWPRFVWRIPWFDLQLPDIPRIRRLK
jgi:signal peptidase I